MTVFDDEMKKIAAIMRILTPLPPAQRGRILVYVAARLEEMQEAETPRQEIIEFPDQRRALP